MASGKLCIHMLLKEHSLSSDAIWHCVFTQGDEKFQNGVLSL